MATKVKIEIGASSTLPSTVAAVEHGLAAERLGFDRVSFGDTVPALYHSCYPAVTALLLKSSRIRVGPFVTNPVTRHWSIHGATARALEELAPGRFFLGMGTGDGAVHSVGLKPATLADFRRDIVKLKEMLPPAVPLHMAFSGPKGIALAGELASELTIATGLDIGALRSFIESARAARRHAGVAEPLKIWIAAMLCFAESPADFAALREIAGGMACLAARFAFSGTFEGKNVPEHFRPQLAEVMKRYDFGHHGVSGQNPNAHLFDAHPELWNYLLNRFTVIGTPNQCASRLSAIVRETGADGVWMLPMSTARAPDAARRNMEIAAREVLPVLREGG